MKRALWILLTLALVLCAAPAQAYRVLVTTPTYPGNRPSDSKPDWRGQNNYIRSIRGALDRQGVQYDVQMGDDLPTAQVAAGTVWYGSYSKSYDAVIVTGWTDGTATYSRGFRPDSLTRHLGAWPTIPVLFVGNHIATNLFKNSSTCSTGVTTNIGGSFSSIMGGATSHSRSLYVAGYAEPWKWMTAGMWPMALQSGTLADNAIVRPIIQAAVSNALGIGGATCTDCDGMTRSAADSAVLIRRSRRSSTGTETGVPLFFVWPTLAGHSASDGSAGGTNFSSGVMAMAIAALDSATRLTGADRNPKVIGSAPGWEPMNLAIAITDAGSHSAGAAESFDGEGGGMFQPDSANFKRTLIDSLNSLGIPLTFFYNSDRDTVATYPNELAWYKAVRLGRFSPAITRGLFAQTATASSSVTRPADVWGRVRSRSLYSSDCGTDTLSLYCGLSRIKAFNDSLFAGRTVRTLYAPAWDWVPKNYSRRTLPSMDSLVTVATLLGFNSLVISPESAEQAPGASYVLQSGGSVFPIVRSNPSGLFAGERRVQAYWDFSKTSPAGSFHFAASRGRWGEAASVNLVSSAGHVWGEEFLWGAFSTNGPWFNADYPIYYHYFSTHLSVMEVPASTLGGVSTANTRRFGWWQIKYVANQVKAINRLAGRTVVNLVYTDEL